MPDIHFQKEDLKASQPAFLTAAAYGLCLFPYPSLQVLLGEDLRILLQVEFLVMHSFIFLALLSWMARYGSLYPHLTQQRMHSSGWRKAFWFYLALYTLASFSISWKGPFYFLIAMAATYPVFLGLGRPLPASVDQGEASRPILERVAPADLENWLRLGSAWILSFILYLSCMELFDLSNSVDQWRAEPKTFRAGLTYFLGLGLLEAFGAHRKIAQAVGPLVKKGRPKG